MIRTNLPVVTGYPIFRLAHIQQGEVVLKGFFLFKRLAFFAISQETIGLKRRPNKQDYYEITMYSIPKRLQVLILEYNDIEHMQKICSTNRKVTSWYYVPVKVRQ